MSASAPLGRPSRNTGSVEADCTSATQSGDVVIEVISHAAATSFIHMQMLATIQVPHSMRNTVCFSGAHADSDSAAAAASRCASMASGIQGGLPGGGVFERRELVQRGRV